MTTITAHRTGSGKKIRDRQRLAHLVAGVALVAYVYMPGGPGAAIEVAVRWVILPALAGSGVVMWQWPKVRRWARQLGTRS